MEPFPGDMLLGGCLILSLAALVTGVLVFRYRGGTGPVFLIVAGILGAVSSSIWVVIRSEILDLPVIIPISILILSMISLFISLFLWRVKE